MINTSIINKIVIVSIIFLLGFNTLNAQCIASFAYVDNGNGNYAFTSSMTNGSGGNTYSWNFGDGNSSTLANPSNLYLSSGTYIAYVTITDSSACTSTFSDTLFVNASGCYASFTYIDNGLGNYSFTSTSTGGTNYYWDFGDGNSSTLGNASNTYTVAGTYNICLVIQDTTIGCSDTICQSITVSLCNNNSASFTTTNNGNGNYSFIPTINGGTAPYTYLWDFGDGNNSTLTNSSNTYSSVGIYAVVLTVTDANNCTAYGYDSIQINATPCNIASSFTYTDNGNGNYSFTNASTGNIVSYYWNFGDGTTSNVVNPTHTFLANGVFVVQLAAVDANSCVDYYLITFMVTGVSNPISCNAAFVVVPDSAIPNSVIVYNTSTGTNLTYFWDFGDGNTSTLSSPNYSYTTSGPFQLCLTVDDGAGCVSTYCDSISNGGTIFKQGGFSISVVTPVITETHNNIQSISALSVYPNPAKENISINLSFTEATQTEIFVTDILGNTVSQISNEKFSAGNNKLLWKVTNLSNGIYLLSVKTNNSLQVKKLIINK